jgi:hypothetical protein
MLASILIITVSTVLFFYWFRYTCELILSARSASSYVLGVSEANGLNWAGVASALDQAPGIQLNSLRLGLRSDFSKLDTILNRAAGSDADQLAFERGMLRGYFHASSALFAVACKVSDRAARNMVHTMARVVEHQANLIGERVRPAEMSLS